MKKLKAYLLSIPILLLILILATFLSFLFISDKFNYQPKLLINTIISAKKQSHNLGDHINIIIMGMDKRDDWLEKNQDTDTIILANIDTNTLNTNLIPLPRDLWYQKSQTRINKIYTQSLSQPYPNQYIKDSFYEITGQKIDYVITLNTNILISIIKSIGPVEVDLDYQIIDDQYPNPDYISDPQNNPNPYITVSFSKGKNIIDSSNVTYFVRSRKGSDDIDQGTDMGRSARQQLLIEAILTKIKKEKLYLNINIISNLYNIWSQEITKDIDDQSIIALLFKSNLNIDGLKVSSYSLPVGVSYQDKLSAIYHPKNFRNNAWVYLPTSSDYTSIHQFIDQQLN